MFIQSRAKDWTEFKYRTDTLFLQAIRGSVGLVFDKRIGRVVFQDKKPVSWLTAE